MSRHAIGCQLLYIWLSWVFWLYIIVNLHFYSRFQVIVFHTFLTKLYSAILETFNLCHKLFFFIIFFFPFLCGNEINVLYNNYVCVCVGGHARMWDRNPCSKAPCNVLGENITSSRIPVFYKEARAGVKHFTHREEEKEPTWNIRSETKTWWQGNASLLTALFIESSLISLAVGL